MVRGAGYRAPRAYRLALYAAACLTFGWVAAPGYAQEFRQEFINPSFGGNPFNSDHLLAIANLDRPDEPEEEEDPAQTPEELLVAQLRSQLTSTLTSNILRRIQTAQPGDTGDFTVGDQRITFVRTATETRVTFVNTRTGETSTLIIPVSNATGTAFAGGSSVGAAASAESTLMAQTAPLGVLRNGPLSGRTPPGASAATRGEGALLAPPPLQ